MRASSWTPELISWLLDQRSFPALIQVLTCAKCALRGTNPFF